MNALVVYDSRFGNTERIARVIAAQLARWATVRLETVDDPDSAILDGVDLLVVGGPTHAHGMSIALRTWLGRLERVDGLAAAAFDTRYEMPRWKSGSAARGIAHRLGRRGCRLALPPESFFVVEAEGPLGDGELDRAARWAVELLQQIEPTFWATR